MKHKIKAENQAFTLVELLLGLLIGAIIGLSVYNMFWSSMKLDDKMRHIHDDYMELLLADSAMGRDLENAVNLDLSASYPDAVIFDGQSSEFSFITQTPQGLKRVRYYSGQPDEGTAKQMIGRVVNPSNTTEKGSLSGEFLVRQESSLADWLNETTNDTSTQIVAAGLKKGSFSCQYAPFVKDLHTNGAKAIVYQDNWDHKGLPLGVSCRFILYDPKSRGEGLMFKRDIFLAPVASYYNEQ